MRLRLLFLLWLLPSLCMAQDKDSLRVHAYQADSDSALASRLTKLSKEWAKSNFDSAYYYGNEALKAAENSASPKHLGLAYNAIALAYGYDYRPSESWPYYEKAIHEFLKIGDQERAGAMYSNSGVDYYLAGQLDSAMIRYTSAIPLYTAIDAKSQLARTYNNIALIYNKMGLTQEAVNYFSKSIEMKELVGDEEGIMNTGLNLSSLYYKLSVYDSAQYYATKTIQQSLALGDKDVLSGAYQSLGQTYAEQGAIDSAIYHCEQAYQVALDGGLRARKLTSAASLAFYYSEVDQMEKAADFAHVALQEGADVVSPLAKALCYEVLARHAEAHEDFKTAVDYRKQEIVFRDSANKEAQQDRLENLVTKYERSVKKQELLETEADLANAESAKNRLFAIAAVIASLAFLLVLILVSIMFRNRRRKAMVEERIRDQVRKIDRLQEQLAQQAEIQMTPEKVELDPEEVNALLKNPLSDREMEVLKAVVSGKTNKEVAEELFVSVNTVKTHLARIYEKLNVSNRTEAADKVSRMKLLD